MTKNKNSAPTTTRSDGKVKLGDVARKAGVSPATVSRVLNHPEIVSPELRERVGRAVTALAYTRDSAGRALKSRRTRTLGVIVPTLGISIFAEGVEAMQNRLSEHGYTLLIANSQYEARRELQEVASLLEHGVDGLALVGDAQLPETHQLIRQHGVPYLTTYVATARDTVQAIGIDNEGAAASMARYLLDLGHRHFGIIANLPESNDRSMSRYLGIRAALAEADVPLPHSHVISISQTLQHGRQGLRHLIQANPEISAVMCTTDTLAIGALAEARSLGLKVPQHISITGFDDIELASQFDPPLTTISVPASEIGRAAADHLVNAAAGVRIPVITTLPHRLIIRGSAGPMPAGIRRPKADKTAGS
jgi:LacI family transcriptional regulator